MGFNNNRGFKKRVSKKTGCKNNKNNFNNIIVFNNKKGFKTNKKLEDSEVEEEEELKTMKTIQDVFRFYLSLCSNKYFIQTRDGNGSGWAQIVPTRNPTHKKKIRPLPARLLTGYPLKKYPRIFLKPAGTRGYPIPTNI